MAHESLFKEHYFFELSRKDALNSALSLPAGLIGLLVGALFAMASQISSPFSVGEIVLAQLLIASAISLVASTFFLIRVLWNLKGHRYRYMPLIHDLYQYKAGLVNYYLKKGNSQAAAETLAEEQFNPNVDNAYADSAQHNCKKNDSKSANIFWAHTFIVAAIVFTMFAAFTYISLTFDRHPEPHRIEVVNLKEIAMSPDQDNQDNQAPAEKPAENTRDPDMPAMPPTRDIKEHTDPLRQK